jgi:plastocyanin
MSSHRYGWGAARLGRLVGLVGTVALFGATGTPARPARAAGTTVVDGTVTVDGTCPRLAPHKITKDASVCGAEQANEAAMASPDGGLRNVVVSLHPAKGSAPDAASGTTAAPPPPRGHATIDQVGCMYKPHVQAVTVGSELTLLNNDRVLHNVHGNLQGSPSPVTVFNIAMPIKGQKLPTKLTRPGIVHLQCDAGHTWMSAWIHVFREPTFAVTDDRGHFSIPDVAPGEYTIEYWHEPLDGIGAGITKTAPLIVGGKPVHADARLKL